MSKNMTTVLIVDDDPHFRQLMVKLLSQAGYYPLEARSASEAEHSLSFEPDLIIVDFRMPGMDGFAWITQLRERGNQVPIAFCSGSKFDEQKLSILRSLLRVGLIIQKPIEPQETLAQIKRLLPPKLVERIPPPVAPVVSSYLSAFDNQAPDKSALTSSGTNSSNISSGGADKADINRTGNNKSGANNSVVNSSGTHNSAVNKAPSNTNKPVNLSSNKPSGPQAGRPLAKNADSPKNQGSERVQSGAESMSVNLPPDQALNQGQGKNQTQAQAQAKGQNQAQDQARNQTQERAQNQAPDQFSIQNKNQTTNGTADNTALQAANNTAQGTSNYSYFYEYNPETRMTSTAYDLPALGPISAGASSQSSSSSSQLASSAKPTSPSAASGPVASSAASSDTSISPSPSPKASCVDGQSGLPAQEAAEDFAYTFEIHPTVEKSDDIAHVEKTTTGQIPVKSLSELMDAFEPDIDDELKELRDEYSHELPSILGLINLNLLMASGSSDMELIWSAGACAHQIAGTSGSLGLTGISVLAKQLEKVLDGIKPAEVAGGDKKMAQALALTQEARRLADDIVSKLPPLPTPQIDAIAESNKIELLENVTTNSGSFEMPEENRPVTGSFEIAAIGSGAKADKSLLERMLVCSSDSQILTDLNALPFGEDLFIGLVEESTLIAQVLELKPDVILLDDRYNGNWESQIKEIRAIANNYTPKIVVLISQAGDRERIFRMGADDFALLPLLPAELCRRVGL